MEPRQGYMADIYASLTPEEKRFISEAASMFEDGFDRRKAGEIALGIVLERRGPSEIMKGPDPRQRSYLEGAEREARSRPTRMSYKSAGDAPSLNTTEGQKLAKDLGPMAIMDDDFMKLTIAKLVGPQPKPMGMVDKFLSEADLLGTDNRPSPYGKFSEPIPPKKKKKK